MRRTIACLIFTLAACGSSGASGGDPKSPKPGTTAAADPTCPVAVPGTSVTVEDAANGAALVFVTTGDIGELRRRASAMAKAHNDHHAAMGPLPDGNDTGGGHAGHDMAGHDMAGHGSHGGGQAGTMINIHSKATASEIDGGAKVLFVCGAADVGKLQSELRMHAQHLGTGTCAMGS